MKLEEIIKRCAVTSVSGNTAVEIDAITNDSRKVAPGSLFVAVSGCGNDGRQYIKAAIEAGAAAVILEEGDPAEKEYLSAFHGTTVHVKDSRLAAAMAADAFYEHPSGKLNLVGITGTNGKTTTVTLLYNLFRSLGYECGLMSTIANYVGSVRLETANTTSDPITINALLDRMCKAGCEYCFMEVSSIGVDQKRVEGP